MIGAGQLTTKVTAYQRSTTADALGRLADTWSNVGSFRGDLRDQGATEREWGQGAAVVRSFELRARWLTVQALGVTERHRLEANGRTLRITAIEDMHEKHRVAVIRCEEVSA